MEYSCSSRVITTTRRNSVAKACSSGKLDLVYKLERPRSEDEDATAEMESVEVRREVDDAFLISGSRGCSWKNCMLYLGTLPDQNEFERESLVRKWVAEELAAEEHCYKYFDALVDRSVILKHPNGQHCYRFDEEATYHVRPTILVVLRKMSQDEGFVRFISNNNGPASPPPGTPDPQRLCSVYLISQSQLLAPASAPAPAPVAGTAPPATLNQSVTTPELVLPLRHPDKDKVRVSDLEGCKGVRDEDVVEICSHLTLLRYLSLKGTPVTVIPTHITNLTNLEVLDVRETRLEQLPEEVALLLNLQHLLFSAGVRFLNQGSSSSSSSIKVLGAVHQSELQPCLAYAKEVREVAVACDGEDLPGQWPAPSSAQLHLHKLKVVRRCVKLPFWIKEGQQLSKVTILDIRMCQLDDDDGDLDALGRMASLRSLALSLVSLPTKQIDIRSSSDHGNPLEVFALDCRVPWVSFQEKAMPALHSLYLKLYDSAGLKTPSGTIHLASLREVTLHFSTDYARSASVTHTVAAVEEELAHHTGNVPIALFVDKKYKIPKIQASGDIVTMFSHWCMRNFLECVAMPAVYLALWCQKRAAHPNNQAQVLYILFGIVLPLFALPDLLSYCLVPKITNMLAHEIARRVFASGAITLPLPLVFYAAEGNSKWPPVLYFSIFILLDACYYRPFTVAFPMILSVFLVLRKMYVQTGSINWPLIFFFSLCFLIGYTNHLHPGLVSYTTIWKFVSSRVASIVIRLPFY